MCSSTINSHFLQWPYGNFIWSSRSLASNDEILSYIYKEFKCMRVGPLPFGLPHGVKGADGGLHIPPPPPLSCSWGWGLSRGLEEGWGGPDEGLHKSRLSPFPVAEARVCRFRCTHHAAMQTGTLATMQKWSEIDHGVWTSDGQWSHLKVQDLYRKSQFPNPLQKTKLI